MTIVLPGGADPHDPMVQQAMQQEMQQAKAMQIVNAIKMQFITSVYANIALQHSQSGEKLSFEKGRALAAAAAQVAAEYDPFLFEVLGMAQLEKKEQE